MRITLRRRAAASAITVIGLAGAYALAVGQASDPPPPPSLKSVTVPKPHNLGMFIRDEQAAIQLGKALFWDMQIGSDGRTACATCHFHAGADSRSINQLNPGTLARGLDALPTPDTAMQPGANAHLTPDLFPLRKLADPTNRNSGPVRDSNDVVGSQGVFAAAFQGVVPGRAEEQVLRLTDPLFSVNGLNVRQVQPRNAPTVINAVFNHRNFWDGSAQNEFNGVNQWGDRDGAARVVKVDGVNQLVLEQVRLPNSSLASQATAPVLSSLEMSADGRVGPDVANKLGKKHGKRLVMLLPLATQLVHPDDSVLGKLSRWPEPGLKVKDYETMISRAFYKEWWQAQAVVRVAADGTVSFARKNDRTPSDDNEYSVLEYNFPLFFGLALQMYQATLVSDDTPYDRWREGRGTLSPEALLGLEVFLGQAARTLPNGTRRAGARCINCHAGAEFTDASVSSINANGLTRLREGQDLDRGYNNIGVRPWRDDLGVGGKDPWDRWLSVTRKAAAAGQPSGRYIAVDGAFKAPGLRNVELTAPYFHSGGYATLEDVVDFYSRGGDFAPLLGADGVPIQPLSVPLMSAEEKAGMVAFLKSLTDERVRLRQAPFDHPQLFVPHGQLDDHRTAQPDPARAGQALDRWREVPAVGRNGGPPLAGFMQYR